MDITHEMIWKAFSDDGRFVAEGVIILDGYSIRDEEWDAAQEWQEGDGYRVLAVGYKGGSRCEAWAGGEYFDGSSDCVERTLDNGRCDDAVAAAACFHGVLGDSTPLLDGDDFADYYADETGVEHPVQRDVGPIDGMVWDV